LNIGVAFGLVAAMCQAGGAVLSRKAFALARQQAENIDGVTAAYQRILGGVLIGLLMMLWLTRGRWWPWPSAGGKAGSRGAQKPWPAGVWKQAWPWLVANSLAGPSIGVSFYQAALKAQPSYVVLPIVAITPLVIIPFSYHLEGERPTWRSLAGGVMAVAGAASLAYVAGHGK
jgi:drug/metabolite transporter (DMT)-like permease